MKRSEMLTMLVGLVITLGGLFFLVTKLLDTAGSISGEVPSGLIMVVGGILVITRFRKNLKNATIVTLLILAVSTIIGNVYYLTMAPERMDAILTTVNLVASVILIYVAFSLFFNTTAGSIKGILVLGIMVILEMFPTLYGIYMGAGFIEQIVEDRDSLAYGIIHLVVLVILTRDDMMIETLQKRLSRNATYLYDAMCTPAECYIDVRDLDAVLDGSQDGWVHYESGPIESEKTVRLQKADICLHLQKWRGDQKQHIAIAAADSDSYSIPLSFTVESMVLDKERPDTSKIRFYGETGVFVDILVKDIEDERKGYVGTIRAYAKKEKKEE